MRGEEFCTGSALAERESTSSDCPLRALNGNGGGREAGRGEASRKREWWDGVTQQGPSPTGSPMHRHHRRQKLSGPPLQADLRFRPLLQRESTWAESPALLSGPFPTQIPARGSPGLSASSNQAQVPLPRPTSAFPLPAPHFRPLACLLASVWCVRLPGPQWDGCAGLNPACGDPVGRR